MKGWVRYRKSLSRVWQGLTEVSVALQAMQDETRADVDALLDEDFGHIGSHLQDLEERLEELSSFVIALRDLVDRAEQRGISGFDREAVKTRLKSLQRSKK